MWKIITRTLQDPGEYSRMGQMGMCQAQYSEQKRNLINMDF